MVEWTVPLSDVRYDEAEIEAVAGAYRRGWLSQGPRVAEFEAAFADYVGSRHAVAVANGTAALHLSCVAAGVGEGDEVVLPSLTFAATAAAVVHSGAVPVFAEIRSTSEPWLSAAAAQDAIGPRTRALINVWYGGHPGDAQALSELARAHGLTLIEDAAHAAGAELDGRRAGTLGRVGAFSFFANKNVALGEGGMLVTDDGQLARRARLLRSHALSSDTWTRHHGGEADYDVLEPGFNYRLDEARASLGLLLLERLASDNQKRMRLAARYAEALRSLAAARSVLPETAAGVTSAWHIYPLLLDPGIDRNAFRSRLAAAGVQTSVHYPPLHLTRAFGSARPLPATEEYGRRTVTVPLFAHMTDAQLEHVVTAVRDAVRALTR